MKCDKCGQEVAPENDAVLIDAIFNNNSLIIFSQARHFLPVNGCEGSPSRAQYIKGQPKSTKYPYQKQYEARWRWAYEENLKVVRG